VIEWTYHLLCRETQVEEEPQCFILASMFDEHMPTFRATNEFIARKDWAGSFTCLYMDAEPSEKQEVRGDARIFTYSGGPYIPAKYTGFPYENNYLNPQVVCSGDGPGWPEVARDSMKRNFGDGGVEEELPTPLAVILGQTDSKAESLERAFYWVRDKIKYASLKSGHKHIGRSARAQEIVKVGTGDCKDKTYLLGLVCDKLEIPYDIVAISTSQGVLIENHPADQFDHVFLRAKLDSGWVYLDAASVISPFGNVPAWCQGMKALLLDDAGTIIEIPADRPSDNLLQITETFRVRSGTWLEGEFEFWANGHLGRVMDDRWKSYSMAMDDPVQAAQEALRLYLPSALVLESTKLSDASTSRDFKVTGKHRRCPLVALEKNTTNIGRLTWELPSLPISYWRGLQIDRLFAVDFPMEANLQVNLGGEIRRSVRDLSRLDRLTNDISRIEETVTEGNDAIEIRRSVTFEKKIIEGELVREVPATLEHIEQALQFVISLDAS
jgi:hypothetical protein